MANVRRISDSINLGAADIFFTPSGSNTEIYLGLTKDGAVFKYEAEYHDIQADQYGNMILEKVLIGEKCSCEVKVLDTSKDNIYAIMPTARKMSNGSIGFGQRPGLRASKHIGKLRIHPISMGIDNTEYDLIIYAAFNEAGLELAYKKDDEWVIPCKFIGLVDFSHKNGDFLFRIGQDNQVVDAATKPFIDFTITFTGNLRKDETLLFEATLSFTDGTTGSSRPGQNNVDIIWSSDNEEVITIDKNTGVAQVVGYGATSIIANYGTRFSRLPLEVKEVTS